MSRTYPYDAAVQNLYLIARRSDYEYTMAKVSPSNVAGLYHTWKLVFPVPVSE